MARALAGAGLLHPVLDQALGVFPVDTAARAAAALRCLLHDRISADGERAWTSSRLTGDGFPVELTFTTADDRLRYTVEPGSAAATPRQRLDLAIRLVDTLGAAPLADDVKAVFRAAMHTSANLRFGAWIGGRHGHQDNQYKIYVETPIANFGETGLPAQLAAKLGDYPQPRLPDRAADLRMLAYSPASEQWEVYFRVASLAPHHVRAVLAPVGLAAKADELLHYIAAAYGYSLTERLPGESVGVSYTVPAHEAARNGGRSVTLFFFARVFWGGDARIRQQFARCATALGWDDNHYRQLTAALSTRRSWKTHHGIMGITATRSGPIALSIGVRPQDIP